MTVAAEKSIETETRMYMYDLLNTAKEFGFKAEDSWELSMVTVKTRLNQAFNKEPQKIDERNPPVEDLNYLVAFNPKRPRT
jgi:hypothetical protein